MHLKSLSLLFLSGAPLLPWMFWMSSSKKLNWTNSALNGLYTKVRLFFDEPSRTEQIVSSVSPTKNLNWENLQNYDIQQVQQQEATESNSVKSLTVEIPLKHLGRINYYRYCLSSTEKSKLPVESSSQLTSSLSGEDCKLDYFYGNPKDKKVDVKYFLNLLTKWINLQHAINVILFFDKEGPEYLRPTNRTNGDSFQKKLSEACNFSSENYHSMLFNLFSSPLSGAKKCLLSPSVLNVWLSKSKNSSPQATTTHSQSGSSNSQEINEHYFKNGRIEGSYTYFLYEYSTKLKKISLGGNDSQQGKEISFEVKSFPISLEEEKNAQKSCNFNSLYKKYEDRSLNLKEILDSCFKN